MQYGMVPERQGHGNALVHVWQPEPGHRRVQERGGLSTGKRVLVMAVLRWALPEHREDGRTVMHDLFVEWVRVAPILTVALVLLTVFGVLFFLLAFAVFFGVHFGPPEKRTYEQHGLLESIWKLARHFEGIDTKLGRIEASITELRKQPDQDSIRFSIPK